MKPRPFAANAPGPCLPEDRKVALSPPASGSLHTKEDPDSRPAWLSLCEGRSRSRSALPRRCRAGAGHAHEETASAARPQGSTQTSARPPRGPPEDRWGTAGPGRRRDREGVPAGAGGRENGKRGRERRRKKEGDRDNHLLSCLFASSMAGDRLTMLFGSLPSKAIW